MVSTSAFVQTAAQQRVLLLEAAKITAIDTGTLKGGRRQEPGTPVYNHSLTAREARAVLQGEG